MLRHRKDGSELPLWLAASNVLDESGNVVNFVRVFTDISELKASQQQLVALASNDASLASLTAGSSTTVSNTHCSDP